MGNNNQEKFTKEDSKEFFDNINNWISNIDSKISFALAFSGIFLLNVFSNSKNFTNNFETLLTNFSFVLLLKIVLQICTYGFNIISIYFFIKALTPKVKRINNNKSLLFWGDIATFSLDEYKNKVNQLSEDKIKDTYIEQIHTNSIICKEKCKNYKLGLQCMFIGFILYIIGIF